MIRSHRLLEIKDPKRHGIFLYHLGPGPNYRCIFQTNIPIGKVIGKFCRKVMKEIKDAEFENIIIDCSIDILEEVLRQAQQVGIMSEKNKIIVTSLVIIKRFLSFSSRDKGGNFVEILAKILSKRLKRASNCPFRTSKRSI